MMKTISTMILACAMLAGTASGFAQDKMKDKMETSGKMESTDKMATKTKHKKVKKTKAKTKMEKGKMDDKMKTGNGKM